MDPALLIVFVTFNVVDRLFIINILKLMPNAYCSYFSINPQAPVAQKIADEVVFRHFQGEGVEFF